MLGWLGMPLGRLIQAIVGIALLWIGVTQLTAVGLIVMLAGLITTVVAALPPAYRVQAAALPTPPGPSSRR
jgi:hypothetical protein